jgi:hypothetical protein
MGTLPVVLLVAAMLGGPPPDKTAQSDSGRVAELVRVVAAPGTADADRQAAEKELKGLDPVPALPLLVAELERAGTGAAVTPGGAGFAQESDPPAEVRAARALGRLWDQYMWSDSEVVWVTVKQRDGSTRTVPEVKDNRSPETKQAIGAALAALLKGDRAEWTRRLVLRGLRRNYAPAAEAPLAAILEKMGDPDQDIAAEILLERHPKKYAATVIDLVADPDRPAASRHLYLSTFLGGPARAIDEADRRRLVRAGFALLAKSREYFTACNLGLLVGQEFKPNARLAKYQGPHSLTDAFFADTVAAALTWWAAHRKEFE